MFINCLKCIIYLKQKIYLKILIINKFYEYYVIKIKKKLKFIILDLFNLEIHRKYL